MAWPEPVDYSQALQDPGQCFAAQDLAQGIPAPAADGTPLVDCGDSACVYRVSTAVGDVAVRCFTREVTDQPERYARLGDYLRGGRPGSMVGFDYAERGIRVAGEWYPVLRMDWAEGVRLDRFVAGHLNEPQALFDLAARWREAVTSLRDLGIAHNDLEPGNVIVPEQGPLRFVDYDGMFIPGLRGQQSPEVGHRNYRHPIRTVRDYDEDTDNFPSVAIYLTLLALKADPGLWQRFHGRDNLLLTGEDFANPARSPCFQALRSSPDPYVADLAAALENICSLPVNQAPDLQSLIWAVPGDPQPAPVTTFAPQAAPPPAPPSAPPPAPPPARQAAPPEQPAPMAVVSGDGPTGLNGFLMSGKLLLGVFGAGLVSLALASFLQPAQYIFVVVLAVALSLASFQARLATRYPVAAVSSAGVVFLFITGLEDNGQLTAGQAAAISLFCLAIILIGLCIASRLLGFSRPPEPVTGVSAFFDGLGAYNRLGMSLVFIGWPAALVGLVPQEVLNAVLPGGVDYYRAGGINESAAWLFWPMMVLDKVEFLGGMVMWLGIALLLFGTPRSILFMMISRRGEALLASDRRREAEERVRRAAMSDAARSRDSKDRLARARRGRDDDKEESNPVDDARTIQLALGMMVFGILAFQFASIVVEGFLFPTALEIGAAAARDYDVLYTNWVDLPWWVRVPTGVLKYAGAIAGIIGLIFFVVSLRSVGKIFRGIDGFMDLLDQIVPPSPPGSGVLSTESGSRGTPDTPAAHGGMWAASRRGRGGGRGGGR